MPKKYQADLANAVAAAAVTKSTISDQILETFKAIEAEAFKAGRSLIDTPEERKLFEEAAVKAFNAVFSDRIGTATTAIIDGMIVAVIDRFLVWLAATPPAIVAPTPAPPAPAGAAP